MRCFGGGHGSAGALGFNFSETDFTWAAGGGLDFAVSRHFGIRMAQVDFLQTRSNGSSQNNVRMSVGVVFKY
jgi:opacity protein-like surface antigen